MLNCYWFVSLHTRERAYLTYDKTKCYLQDKMLVYKFFLQLKSNHQKVKKLYAFTINLPTQVKETMNAYTLLMKVVLDVKQEKEEVKVATLVFSKDDDRDKIANKTKIAPKEVKEIVVDYAVADFDHDLSIDFSDYGTEANATAKLSLQNLEKAPVKYFDKKAQ